MKPSMLYQLLTLCSLFTATQVFAAEHKIIQKDRTFNVTELEIKAGDSITFINEDTVMHNLYSRAPENKFEIKRQDPGQSSTITFPTAGAIKVRCAIHPTMTITVNVK